MTLQRTPFGLLIALAVLAAAPARSEGYGRWEIPLRQCQLLWAGEGSRPPLQSDCLSLRLDQTIEGLLRVRFIKAGAGSRFASEELTFVGLLRQQDGAMRCDQGRCAPSWPMHIALQGVAALRFDSRGLAETLPKVHLATGSCLLERQRLQCEARAKPDHQWRASATTKPGER